MPKTRLQKEETVVDLTQKFERSSSVVFTDYKGLTMTQLSGLRKSLRETDAEFEITKNSLVKLALKDSGVSLSDEILEGPTATLFAFGDQVSPIKALVKTLKEANTGKVKAGILDGEVLDSFTVIKLSQLPSQDELRAKVVGSLASPLYGIVGVLQANLRNLVYALDQIRVLRGGEA